MSYDWEDTLKDIRDCLEDMDEDELRQLHHDLVSLIQIIIDYIRGEYEIQNSY